LDSKLFREPTPTTISDHDQEVQTFTILRGAGGPVHHHCGSDGECSGGGHSHLEVESNGVDDTKGLEQSLILDALGSLPKENIWRVKGFVRLLPKNQAHILNWAFGRYELDVCDAQNAFPLIQLTVMGRRGEMKRSAHRLAEKLGGSIHASSSALGYQDR